MTKINVLSLTNIQCVNFPNRLLKNYKYIIVKNYISKFKYKQKII